MARRRRTIEVQGMRSGVSQQPSAQRLQDHATEQLNAYSSMVDGLGKRQPVEHIKNITAHEAGIDKDALIHWIDRDADNRYLLAFGGRENEAQLPITALNATDGTGYRVTMEGGGALTNTIKNYLKTGVTKPREDLIAMTVGDTTFVVNRRIKPKLDESVVHDADNHAPAGQTAPDWLSRSAKRAFLFLKAVSPHKKYAVRVHTFTGKNTKLTQDVWDPPRRQFGGRTRQQNLDRAVAWVKTFDGNLGQPRQAGANGYGGPLDNPAYNVATTLYEGHQIGTTQLTEVLHELVSRNQEPVALAAFRAASSRYHGGIRATYDRERAFTSGQSQMRALVRWSVLTAKDEPPIVQHVAKLELNFARRDVESYREKIMAEVVETGEEGDALFTFSDEVERLDQLPLICQHGHNVKVVGSDPSVAGYWLTFKVTAGADEQGVADRMGHGKWQEGLAPLSKPKIDPDTMPIIIKRVPDGGGSFRFEVSQPDWSDMLVGDDETNPAPGFIGHEIDDIFFWRNRLGILANNRVVMSQADKPYSFWRTTVQQLLDTDPIERNISQLSASRARHAVPFDEVLMLFSESDQHVMRGDPTLTPRTARLDPLTRYKNCSACRPEPTESGIFFSVPSSGRAFRKIGHLLRVAENDVYDAFPAADHAPRYIKGDAIQMTATSAEQALAVRTADPELGGNTLWIYKWFDQQGQRVLNAWMKFQIGGGVNSGGTQGAELVGMQFFDDELHLLINRQGVSKPHLCLEKITFSGQRQPDVFPQKGDAATAIETKGSFRCLLDRRITNKNCTFAFDAATDELKITLPYEVERDPTQTDGYADMRIVERAPSSFEGREYPIASREVVTVAGVDYTVLRVSDVGQVLYDALSASTPTTHLFIGQTYEMLYEFSVLRLRQRSQAGPFPRDIKRERVQLRRGHLALEDSGYGEVLVGPALRADGGAQVDRDERIYDFPTFIVASGQTHLDSANIRDGEITFPINSTPENVRIRLRNRSPFPFNPKSLEVSVDHTIRP